MKKTWPLIALGVGAFLLLALITLPASVVLSYAHPSGLTLGGVSGTIWQGRAQAVRAGALHLGSVEWSLNALALFTGRLGADVKITRTDGFAQSSITAAPTGTLTFRSLNASLPLGALPPNVAPGGWTGTLNLKLPQLTLENGWPVVANGAVEITDLVGPARRPVALGSYKIEFPAEAAAAAEVLNGALSDLGGPFAVNGSVQIKKDRSYLVQGMIATRPGAPGDMARSLEILGPADAQGRRPFTFEGSM